MRKGFVTLSVLLLLVALGFFALAACGGEEARGAPLYKGTFIAGDDDYFSGELNTENVVLPSVARVAIAYGTASGTVLTVPSGATVEVIDVFYQVTTNFDCTGDDCTLDVGTGDDADGFLDCADANLQTTFTDYTGADAGWGGLDGSAPTGAFLVGGPHITGGAETIDYAIGGTDPAGGAGYIYVVYRVLEQ